MGKFEVLKIEYARLEEKANQLQKQVDSLTKDKAKVEQDLMKQTTSAALLAREVEDMRRKMRESTNDALGTSMELEKVRDDLDAMRSRLNGLTTGGSGMLKDVEDVVRVMKEKMQRARHNVRIVLPRLTDFERHGLMSAIEKIPPLIVINLATSLDPSAQANLITNMQEKHIQLTNFSGENEYGLIIDGEECVIGLVDPKNPDKFLGGMFTNIVGLTTLFMDAIQVAFVKGMKVTPSIAQLSAPKM